MNELLAAVNRYIPKPYDGRIVVYQARTEPLRHLFENDRCWRAIARDMIVVEVPGTHLSLIREPHVQVIADDLRLRLDALTTGEEEIPVHLGAGHLPIMWHIKS